MSLRSILKPEQDDDEPMRLSLTAAEQRLVLYEATRLKNKRAGFITLWLDSGDRIHVKAYNEAA